jgi:DNA-binding NarL/FixJ family response regulator
MRLSLAAGHRLAIARGLQALAALASASGDIRQAVRLAGAARAANEAIGAQPSAAGNRRIDSLLDVARGTIGPDAVTSLLAEGRAMSPHQAAASMLAPVREPAAAATSTGGGPLSERELEVATLAARGLSNRAIAAELYIAQATVARHIANIFGKLRLTSRAQLAAWMADNRPPAGA